MGFSGVLLIVKPSPSAFNLYAGLALSAAVLVIRLVLDFGAMTALLRARIRVA